MYRSHGIATWTFVCTCLYLFFMDMIAQIFGEDTYSRRRVHQQAGFLVTGPFHGNVNQRVIFQTYIFFQSSGIFWKGDGWSSIFLMSYSPWLPDVTWRPSWILLKLKREICLNHWLQLYIINQDFNIDKVSFFLSYLRWSLVKCLKKIRNRFKSMVYVK